MLSDELLAQVKALDEADKLALLRTLLMDPALSQYAYDPLGLRTNYKAAQILMEMLEEEKAKTQQEVN